MGRAGGFLFRALKVAAGALVAAAFLVVAAGLSVGGGAFAAVFDAQAACSLTVEGARDVAADVSRLQAWRVADFADGAGAAEQSFEISDDFAELFEDGAQLSYDVDEWAQLASSLAGYALNNGVDPVSLASVDDDGRAKFESLRPGLYLVADGDADLDVDEWTISPFLVQLPYAAGTDAAGETLWEYDVVVQAKFLNAGAINLVLPATIDIDDPEGDPAGDGQTSGDVDEVQQATIDVGDGAGAGVGAGGAGAGGAAGGSGAGDGAGAATLPQTGMLLWPIPVLLAAGLACVACGLYRRHASEG